MDVRNRKFFCSVLLVLLCDGSHLFHSSRTIDTKRFNIKISLKAQHANNRQIEIYFKATRATDFLIHCSLEKPKKRVELSTQVSVVFSPFERRTTRPAEMLKIW
jgi:hypothetical protein